jgi:caffeoyl-CoA O-methyltransferase
MGGQIGLSDALLAYLVNANPEEHPVLARCRAETERDHPDLKTMQISPEQGAFLAFLARMIRAQHALEVGVFTGYSALATVLAMKETHGDKARLTACEISEDYLETARGYWREADVEHQVPCRLGAAADSLKTLLAEDHAGRYDMAFIDADKTGYDDYYESCLKLLRKGGVMAFDNVLWSGSVADPGKTDKNTEALRAIARKARGDDRIASTIVPVGDGMLLCLKL